jgi:tetratricopeptide (TPR) repeat protein
MRTPLALDVVAPLAVLIALVVAAWRWRQAQPLFAFAVGWTLLVLTPTSSVMPIADLAVERRMYLPLAGLLLFAAAGLHEVIGRLPVAWRRRPRVSYGLAATALIALLAPLTWQRASLWGDAVALHLDGVAKAPGNPRVRLNLGATYLNAGKSDLAYETLLEAKRLYDEQRSVHAFPRIGAFITYNLGAVMFARRDFAAAEAELTRSLELGGQYLALRPMANMLLARIAAARGEWSVAAERMGEAVKYIDNPDWIVDRAQMLIRADNAVGARMLLQQVLQQKPGFARAQALLNEMGG